MADKTVTITNTGFMKITDLLDATETTGAFDAVIIKIGNARGLKQDDAGKAFIFSKLDELAAYVSASKTGIPTLDEVRVIIERWLKLQEAEATPAPCGSSQVL